jgi:EAL domain-containing protein (putative c-di-GMP-specific phosphodiesterase class I)
MQVQDLTRSQVASDRRRALDQQELQFYYQPIVDLGTWEVLGVEALLHWHHPQLGTLLPREFLPVAEESRLMSSIGGWVLKTVCDRGRTWHDRGHSQLRVALNISPRQFADLQLVEMVPRVLAETGLDPRFLQLEVGEETVMKDVAVAVRTLDELSRIGIHVAIDGFGTGSSSLSHLKYLPAGSLKIGRAFIGDVAERDSTVSGRRVGDGGRGSRPRGRLERQRGQPRNRKGV